MENQIDTGKKESRSIIEIINDMPAKKKLQYARTLIIGSIFLIPVIVSFNYILAIIFFPDLWSDETPFNGWLVVMRIFMTDWIIYLYNFAIMVLLLGCTIWARDRNRQQDRDKLKSGDICL